MRPYRLRVTDGDVSVECVLTAENQYMAARYVDLDEGWIIYHVEEMRA